MCRATEYALGGAGLLEETFLVANKSDVGKMDSLIKSVCKNKYEAGKFRVVYFNKTQAIARGYLYQHFSSNKLPPSDVVTAQSIISCSDVWVQNYLTNEKNPHVSALFMNEKEMRQRMSSKLRNVRSGYSDAGRKSGMQGGFYDSGPAGNIVPMARYLVSDVSAAVADSERIVARMKTNMQQVQRRYQEQKKMATTLDKNINNAKRNLDKCAKQLWSCEKKLKQLQHELEEEQDNQVEDEDEDEVDISDEEQQLEALAEQLSKYEGFLPKYDAAIEKFLTVDIPRLNQEKTTLNNSFNRASSSTSSSSASSSSSSSSSSGGGANNGEEELSLQEREEQLSRQYTTCANVIEKTRNQQSKAKQKWTKLQDEYKKDERAINKLHGLIATRTTQATAIYNPGEGVGTSFLSRKGT